MRERREYRSGISSILLGGFLWCLGTAFQLLSSTAVALLIVFAYSWAFPRKKESWSAGSDNILTTLSDFGYGWFAAVVGVCFVISFIVSRQVSRENASRRDAVETNHKSALTAKFGESAVVEPAGGGYLTTLTVNGKEYTAGHQMHSVKGRHQTVNTASAWVSFPIADREFEMSIVQPRFWITPNRERLSLGLTADSDPLSVLSQRYECSCSDRAVIQAFISDSEVARELLPTFPNSYERSSLIIKNGEVRLECTADTKSDVIAAESATFSLSKKLISRAEIFDRRLREIGKA